MSTPSLMQDYIANIEFSLNFEDNKKSVKVRIGDIVQYDGTIAKYKKATGEEISGKTSSLRSAIATNWLTLNVKGATPGPLNVKVEKVRDNVPVHTPDKMSDHMLYQTPQFDNVRGGDFDTFLKKDGTIQVIAEEDRIVKKTAGSKMEVAGDQVLIKDVAEGTTVSSSTAVPKNVKSHKTKVVVSEHYNSEGSIPIKNKASSKSEDKKAETFTVDAMTPRVADDATLKEVQRVTKPTIQAEESQDAVVVKKVNMKKAQIEETEGITVTTEISAPNEKEIDVSAKVGSGSTKEMDASVSVATGSTHIADLSDAKSQDQADQAGKPVLKKGQEAYLDQLPADWAKMHWVKKEQFIKQLTDKEFIKFILTVESVKAVQNACRKRLVELEKLQMQK